MIKIDTDAMYAYINTTKLRDMEYDVLAENALRARNELATLNSGEDDDRIDELLTLVEILEDYCDDIERLPDWETIANDPSHPQHKEIMAELGFTGPDYQSEAKQFLAELDAALQNS